MTDQEKIRRHDAIQKLRQLIGGCFGNADGIFASHSNDEKRAKELRKIALDNQIELKEIREIILLYLFDSKFPIDLIKEQLEKATIFFELK